MTFLNFNSPNVFLKNDGCKRDNSYFINMIVFLHIDYYNVNSYMMPKSYSLTLCNYSEIQNIITESNDFTLLFSTLNELSRYYHAGKNIDTDMGNNTKHLVEDEHWYKLPVFVNDLNRFVLYSTKVFNNTLFHNDNILSTFPQIGNIAKKPIMSITTIEPCFDFRDILALRSKPTNNIQEDIGYILETLLQFKSIYKIPYALSSIIKKRLTKGLRDCDGIVTKEWRKYANYQQGYISHNIKPYDLLMKAKFAGFVGINEQYKNIDTKGYSFDKSSCYPSYMCYEKYPHGVIRKLEKDNITYDDLYELRKLHRPFIYHVKFDRLTVKFSECCDYLPVAFVKNKQYIREKELVLTSVDFDNQLLEQNYFYDNMQILEVYYWFKEDYLPQRFRELIFSEYRNKTKFKGLKNSIEYEVSKTSFDTIYGISLFDERLKDKKVKPVKNTQVYYPASLGVFTMAYARAEIFSLLKEIDKDDIIKFDTDCITFKNKKYFDIFKKRNIQIYNKIKELYPNFSKDLVFPKDNQNVIHIIGFWENEYKQEVTFRIFNPRQYTVIEKNKVSFAGCYSLALDKYLENHNIKDIEVDTIIPEGNIQQDKITGLLRYYDYNVGNKNDQGLKHMYDIMYM